MINREPFPGWIIKETLGNGAFGSVYRAEKNGYSSVVKQIVVPKENDYNLVFSKFKGNKEKVLDYYKPEIEKIKKKIETMRMLSGVRGIVIYYDYITREYKKRTGWEILIRMEYLMPLENYLLKNGMTIGKIIDMGLQLCNALEVCYNEKILHRNVKEKNILIDTKGNFKLCDFGVSKMLEQLAPENEEATSEYIAPELYKGHSYDHRTEIYSLGMVMYKLLNEGKIPFLSNKVKIIDEENARKRILRGELLPDPTYGNKLIIDIVRKACEYEVDKRYSSFNEMGKALEFLRRALDDDFLKICTIKPIDMNKKNDEKSSIFDDTTYIKDKFNSKINTETKPQEGYKKDNNEIHENESSWEMHLDKAEYENAVTDAVSRISRKVKDGRITLDEDENVGDVDNLLEEDEYTNDVFEDKQNENFQEEIVFDEKKNSKMIGRIAKVSLAAFLITGVLAGTYAVKTYFLKNSNVPIPILKKNEESSKNKSNELEKIVETSTEPLKGQTEFFREYKGHTGTVTSIMLNEKEDTLLSTSYDKSINEWDVSTGVRKATYEGHSDKVNAAIYNNEGTKILSISDDKTMKQWDVKTQRCIKTYNDELGFDSAYYKADGSRILSSSGGIIKELDAKTGKELKKYTGYASKNKALYNSDGSKILYIAGDGKKLEEVDTSSGKVSNTYDIGSSAIESFVYDNSYSKILVTLGDGTVNEIELKTKNIEHSYKVPGNEKIYSSMYNKKGDKIWTVSENRELREWNEKTQVCLNVYKDVVNQKLCLSADDDKIITTDNDKIMEYKIKR